MQIQDKIILLTGGTAGIGKQIALQLKAQGATVTVTGRNPDRLKAMEDAGFSTVPADLSNPAGVDAFLAEWGERDLDILINNAGQLADHDFRQGTPDPDEADTCIYTNLSAPIRVITALVERMRARPAAAIVNVTSGLAIAPAARQPVYCATKSGLRFYTLALREQLKDTNIQVIEALPPVVDTQMNDGRSVKKMSPEECARQIVEAIEKNRDEANIGMTKMLRWVESISPVFAKRITLKF